MHRDTLIENLKKDLSNGIVVTIAGTGVSVAACNNQKVEGFPVATWTGLLQHGVQHCKDIGAADDADVELLGMQIKSGKINFLIAAAEDISQRLQAKGPGQFLGWLKATIGKLAIEDSSILESVAALPGVLATLNYDNLLEDATKRRAVTWQNPDSVQEVLTRVATDAVLHLHGWYREPDSVVLGLSSYLAVKDHPHAKAVLNLFTLDRTLLFIGCGDTVLDPNFARLIEWGKEALRDVAPRHYLLCRTSEIPKFQGLLANAPWLQSLDYGADYKDLIPFLRTLAPLDGVVPSSSPASLTVPKLDIPQYQQAMRKRYSHLKLDELDPTTHDLAALTLTGMFIAQSVRECAEFMPRLFELPKELQYRLRNAGEMEESELDNEMLEKHRRAYLDQSPRPILDITSDVTFQRLVILGDPGSGKSTLLQYLILIWAEKASVTAAADALPLIIELREYGRLRAEGSAIGFLEYLHCGESVRCHFDQAYLDSWLKTKPSLILFDGLDEIFDLTLRKEISTAIHRFADNYPLARIIVTSRIVGYLHQAWHHENFRHFMLQELDELQISDFLVRWHRTAYAEFSKGESKRTLLTRAIEDSSAIRQLAGNPLLLTMMAILNRTQDLPRDRAELYEQCARLLLHQWKVDTAFSSYRELAHASLDFKDKRSLLLRVARAMQTSERGLAGNLIDEHTLESTIEAGLNGIPNLRPDRAARALIEQLRGRNFMLCSMGGRSYAFVHRTFLEYFCAVEIRERFQTEQSITIEQLKTEIFGHWADETWHEVLCLLSGMLSPRFVAEILDWLLEQSDPDHSYLNIYLAARCVGEVRKRGELGDIELTVLNRLKHPIMKLESSELAPDIEFTLKAIQSLPRTASIVSTIWRDKEETPLWLKRQADLRKLTAAAASSPQELLRRITLSFVGQKALQELARGWKDAPETLPWIKDLVRSPGDSLVRQSAVQELAHGWKHDPEVLPILKACAELDEHPNVRQSAVQAVARSWQDHPETLSWLENCVQFNNQKDVRQSAVHELARGWRNNPETLPWLKTRAQFDQHGDVRQSALQELAHKWKDDPETLPIIKARAQSDNEGDVRQSALQELARRWKDAPETLSTLKSHAQFDKHSKARKSALKELVRGWKDDPETLQILKARLQSDDDSDVRQSALEELARAWKSNVETLSILKACAQSDTHSDVRETAVQQLARGWKDDAEILPWLKSCLQSDAHEDVRRAAAAEIARGWPDESDAQEFLKTSIQKK